MKTLIKNGLLIDSANQVQAYLNLILEDGKVVAVTEEEPEAVCGFVNFCVIPAEEGKGLFVSRLIK